MSEAASRAKALFAVAMEQGASGLEPRRRVHHADTQLVRKGLVMKKILSLAFVAMLSLALAALFVA